MKKIGYILSFVMLGLLSACSDTDIDTSRGTQPGTLGLCYFTTDCVTDTILLETGPCTFDLTVERQGDVSQAVSVPVVKESGEEGTTVSPAAVFPAGESRTKITVDCSASGRYTYKNIILRIGDDYANPYSQNMDGTNRLNVKFVVSKWNKIVSQASDYIVNPKGGQVFLCKSDFYKLKGLNRYMVSNFMGQGYDMEFELINNDFKTADRTTWRGRFNPLTCYWDYTSYGSSYDSYCIFQKPGDSWGYIYIEINDQGIRLSQSNNDYVECNKGDYSYTGTQDFSNKEGDNYVWELKTMFGSSYKEYNSRYVWTEDQNIATDE